MRGRVQRGGLPGVARFGIPVGEPGGLDGEQGDLVGAKVIRVTGQLAQGVVSDDEVGLERTDVGHQPSDRVVERRVDQPLRVRGGLGVAGVPVAEQQRRAGTEDGEGLGEFPRPGRVLAPGRGNHRGAGTRGVLPGEHAAGEQGLVVRVREHTQQ